ncbi:MAG: MoxR family ATPase [Lachnospiraceae bacterium]|nr:MoxR family ATPase [Lachnospiraceae bacterium]
MEHLEAAINIQNAINGFFIGKKDVIKHILICLITGGHVLIEDVPGTGKTTLAKCFARAVDADFGRIQFTPDTLPSDVTGVSVYNTKSGEFEYREGAIMHQILLADEINRTSPKTQACLLEAMAESQVTVDDRVHLLKQPFMVIATQNPIEYTGTYPLTEASMDRFMMKLSIGYPEPGEEISMASSYLKGARFEMVEKVCDASKIELIKKEVREITIKDSVIGYAREIINLTRNEERFLKGASPRALLSLLDAARGEAYLSGRDHVIPDDIKNLSLFVLAHRLNLTSKAKISGENVSGILRSLILKAKVPV